MAEREQLQGRRQQWTVKGLMDAITALEAQRAVLGDVAVDTALAPLRQQLAELEQAGREPAAPAFAGERKLVTVMFADIAGFTALAERMDPEAVRDLTNACFDRLVPLIEKYGGTVDKFIGDEIMALFGAPVAHENDPERALRAALEMREALVEFNAEHGTDLGIHFGVNTGLVIAGDIGSKGREQYSVIGDAVNVAARLREVSARDEILVGLDTHRLTATAFEFEALEPVLVKGKSKPVPAYRLLAARSVPDRTRGIAGLVSPLVGRQAELDALREAVERLQSGLGGVVTLIGEAGLGKSRLVAEVRSWALGLGVWDLQWVEGRCLSHGTSIAYLLWLDVLRGLLGTTLEDPPVVARDALRDRVQAFCPGDRENVYPYLGRLMSLPLATEDRAVAWNLEGEHLKAATFRAAEILVEALARQHPLVIVCEDLHWADPTSIELLDRLLVLTERVPLLFLCVFRPEREHGCWRLRESALHYHHTDLHLAPLSPAESAILVGNLLQVGDLPSRLRTRILDHAEGNPFYVEEIIRSLIDSGIILRDVTTGCWRAMHDVADITIPDTLHGVLVARIDRLPEETKRVLQLASVIGRIFRYRVLAAIVQEERELDAPALWSHLLTLQQEEMIRERARAPELEYIFKHQLTREAAYNGLLKRERRDFHRQVAGALERSFPDRVEEHLGLLAHHWERAEEPEKATAYLLRAGDQARQAYAHQEAIGYYRRALVFLRDQQDHERAARTLMKLGLTYHTAFDFQQARQTYEEGFASWQRAGRGEHLHAQLQPAPHPLRLAWLDLPTLDPTMTDSAIPIHVINELFSGLVAMSSEKDVVPDMARTWKVSAGGRRYLFQLRDDVYWSDGTPVTAGDFEYAWKRTLDPAIASPNARLLYDIAGASAFNQGEGTREDVSVRALDAVTLAVELQEPTGYFLQLLGCPAMYPVPRHAVEAHGEAWAEANNIVTNGPFRLVSWQRGRSMSLTRNPVYPGLSRGNVQQVELVLLPEWSTPFVALEMYEANDLDVLVLRGPPEGVNDIRQKHAGEYVLVPRLFTTYLALDVRRPPFDDLRVRQAIALAIDKETLANVILAGQDSPATGGFVPPGLPGHSPGIGLPYDPGRARRLLAEAGYPDGRGFPRIEAIARSERESQYEYLRAQWRENLGIDIAWDTMEYGAYVERLRGAPPHMLARSWIADYADPDSFLRVGLPWEQTGWRNDAYEELVEQARRVTDQETRLKLYQQADLILVEESSTIPLTYWRTHLLVKSWVTRFPTSATQIWFWKNVVVEPH